MLTKETESLWASIPGDSLSKVYRSYNIYNFTNPYEFLYLDEYPKMTLLGPYIYQEFQSR